MNISAFVSIFLFNLLLLLPFSSSTLQTLNEDSSLSVENTDDVLISPNGTFSAGFHAVSENAYSFAVWFTGSANQTSPITVVWMANRNVPVNGKRSVLSLTNTGNLVLMDAGQTNVWQTDTSSQFPVELFLDDSGNLVLREKEGKILWQSFDFPTDTLLPQQVLTRQIKLVSSRSETNQSSGFYQLYFDNDNILRLLYDGPEVSSTYWPDPWLVSWEAGRTTYNSSRIAVLDFRGKFVSSDNFGFSTSDYGTVLQRRLKVDSDGNVRVYSRRHAGEEWYVSWQAFSMPCKIHGICGANSMCAYSQNSGRKCSCLPGHRMRKENDWALGCEPDFIISCNASNSKFLYLDHVEYYGYDLWYYQNYTYDQCKNACLELCNCKGFQYSFFSNTGFFDCYLKLLLVNGYNSPFFFGSIYLRLPTNSSYTLENSNNLEEIGGFCPSNPQPIQLERSYVQKQENSSLKFMLWFGSGIGGLEMICIFLVWFFLIRTGQRPAAGTQVHALGPNGFRKFTYSELKTATKNFSHEIGRGAAGIVYKGVLSDKRIAAIKRLNIEANQGEEEFLAEVSSIGGLNHMNLIEMWGYCAEGKHRLLVYQHMEHGSLAENISSEGLDWNKRFNIALGTARGLAYLHEECLEWILHCDVKPQNILLDSNFRPKVADFGLSKLLSRNDLKQNSFSRIRGTRGYMAPEWVFNLPISSKVDVYSYGIVVLEMVTGRSAAMGVKTSIDGIEMENTRLVSWVREKVHNKGNCEAKSWIDEVVDPMIMGDYDERKMEALVRVALQCVEEDKSERPTMSQVVERLQKAGHEENHNQ